MAARQSIAGGKDPIEERKADRAARAANAEAMTFEQAAEGPRRQKPGWKNPKHADQWINTLRDYAFPKIGKRKVDELAPVNSPRCCARSGWRSPRLPQGSSSAATRS